MSDEADLSPAPGTIAREVADELPGLRLDWVTVPGRRARSQPAVAHRLAELSNRYRGASVVTMRTHAIPHAYRSFYRQIGLDPDVDRIPSEEAALYRLVHGGFTSQDLLADALLLALLETGVPVWAIDADVVAVGGLGIRTARAGDCLGPATAPAPGEPVEDGRLVVADSEAIHAILFGPVAAASTVDERSSAITLFSVGVEGVPAIHVEEALWVAIEGLGAG